MMTRLITVPILSVVLSVLSVSDFPQGLKRKFTFLYANDRCAVQFLSRIWTLEFIVIAKCFRSFIFVMLAKLFKECLGGWLEPKKIVCFLKLMLKIFTDGTA